MDYVIDHDRRELTEAKLVGVTPTTLCPLAARGRCAARGRDFIAGLIDVSTEAVETPEQAAQGGRQAAYGKLRALVAGAQIVRAGITGEVAARGVEAMIMYRLRGSL